MKLRLFPTLKNYKKEYLTGDIFAGIIVAAMTIPISMGYAQDFRKYTAYMVRFFRCCSSRHLQLPGSLFSV